MINIIVGGRFDYMKAAWSRMAADKKIIYFENDVLHNFDWKTKIKNHAFQIADRCGLIKQEKRSEHERLNNLLELFDINSLRSLCDQ